jgi:hypothetical protein
MEQRHVSYPIASQSPRWTRLHGHICEHLHTAHRAVGQVWRVDAGSQQVANVNRSVRKRPLEVQSLDASSKEAVRGLPTSVDGVPSRQLSSKGHQCFHPLVSDIVVVLI